MTSDSVMVPGTAVVAMNRQLQKTFQLTEKQIKILVVVIQDNTGMMQTLNNLAEQLNCCNKVVVEGTPLAQFEEVKDSLSVKLRSLLEENLAALASACVKMEKASAQLHRQKEATVTYFQQHGCTVSESLQTETLWPCVATMLEWLENLDNDVHYLYCEKQHLVNSVDFGHIETVTTLATNWKDDHGLAARHKDLMLHLQYFMDETF